MPRGRYTRRRRTPAQTLADERANQLAGSLGRALREGRTGTGVSQRRCSAEAGLAQSTWSVMERGRGANLSVRVWMRASQAVHADLHAYLEAASAAEQPRDAIHLRHQELVARHAAPGGWLARPAARAGRGFC